MPARRPEEEAMPIQTPSSTRRELDHRHSNGIDVTLSWCPAANTLHVTVHDESGDSFELRVAPHEALDVFNHPYAYAASRGRVLLDVTA
jgi:hypothetical protein